LQLEGGGLLDPPLPVEPLPPLPVPAPEPPPDPVLLAVCFTPAHPKVRAAHSKRANELGCFIKAGLTSKR
jgi:hypothetical protein